MNTEVPEIVWLALLVRMVCAAGTSYDFKADELLSQVSTTMKVDHDDSKGECEIGSEGELGLPLHQVCMKQPPAAGVTGDGI